jgi:preprotein translocase subunit SecY
MLYAAAIVFFCFFYYGARLQQPRDRGQPEEERRVHSRHRPGEQTARHIDRILSRLTLAGRDLHHAGVPAARVSWC